LIFPKIKIDVFNNEKYTVKGTSNQTCVLSYIDYTTNFSGNYPSISSNVYSKLINLNSLNINVNLPANINSPYFDYNIFWNNVINIFKEEINKEFIKMSIILGNKHREKTGKFNLNINKKSSKEIVKNLYLANNKIVSNSRYGPAQWIISNSNINEILSDYCFDNFTKDFKCFDSLKYFINENIDNETVIIGRKNTIDGPGIHCLIQTDDNGFINLYEVKPYNSFNPFNTNISIFYSLVDIGNFPEYEYYVLNTNSVNYYRHQKLLKLKELYE